MTTTENLEAQISNTPTKRTWSNPDYRLHDSIIQTLQKTGKAEPSEMQHTILESYFTHKQSMILTAPSKQGSELATSIIALQTALEQYDTIRSGVSDTVSDIVVGEKKNGTGSAKHNPENCKFPSVIIVCKTKEQVEATRRQLWHLKLIGKMALEIEAGSGHYTPEKPTPIFETGIWSNEDAGTAATKPAAFYEPIDILIGTPYYLRCLITKTKSAQKGTADNAKPPALQPKVVSLLLTRLAIWIDGKGLADNDNGALVKLTARDDEGAMAVVKKKVAKQGPNCHSLVVTDPLDARTRHGLGQHLLLESSKVTPTLQWNGAADFAFQQARQKPIEPNQQIWSLMDHLRGILGNTDPKDVQMPKFVALMARDCEDDTVRVLFGADEIAEASANHIPATNPGEVEAGPSSSKVEPEFSSDEAQAEPSSKDKGKAKDDTIQQGNNAPAQDGGPSDTTKQDGKKRKDPKPAYVPTAASRDGKPLGIVVYASLNAFKGDSHSELFNRLRGSQKGAKTKYHDVLFEYREDHHVAIRQAVRFLDSKGLSVPEWMRDVAAKVEAVEAKASTGEKAEVPALEEPAGDDGTGGGEQVRTDLEGGEAEGSTNVHTDSLSIGPVADESDSNGRGEQGRADAEDGEAVDTDNTDPENSGAGPEADDSDSVRREVAGPRDGGPNISEGEVRGDEAPEDDALENNTPENNTPGTVDASIINSDTAVTAQAPPSTTNPPALLPGTHAAETGNEGQNEQVNTPPNSEPPTHQHTKVKPTDSAMPTPSHSNANSNKSSPTNPVFSTHDKEMPQGGKKEGHPGSGEEKVGNKAEEKVEEKAEESREEKQHTVQKENVLDGTN